MPEYRGYPNPPSNITVPEKVIGGQSIVITWSEGDLGSASGTIDSYKLERSTDGATWSTIYTGAERSYTDTITKGWTSVTYRVFSHTDEGRYSVTCRTSDQVTVINNSAPVITCASPSGSDLGVKSEGFSVEYGVGDPDGDTVTVTESIDDTIIRTFSISSEDLKL